MTGLFTALALTAGAQTFQEWRNPEINAVNRAPMHTNYFAFENADAAKKANKKQSTNYMTLNGTWKFNWVKDADSRPTDFWKTGFNDKGWDDLQVPAVCEIVQQVILIRQKVNRIVFMGMGEPLFNYDNLIAAIHILRDRNGLNFPTDGITVSTVGPVNQLKKLREEHLKIQLTISLHAATQAARNCIIPHMHMYAIEDVVKQALSYSQRHNRKVVFAYLLLPGINDRSSDIRQLAKWFKGKNVMINVLQYNPTSNSKIRAPQKQEMVAFKHQLEQTGLEVTMRVSHGREIKAACGQLANTYNKAKKQQK